MPVFSLDGVAPELPEGGNYWIAPTAILIGRVKLMKNASVWFGAVLRGDNDWITIGENSNIQDNSVIHTDVGQPVVIGSSVTVGHNVIVHSARIEEGSLIGMGSILLNDAKIGRTCLVGAGAVVTKKKIFEDGKLILGAPARAVRDLNGEEKKQLKLSADAYVANYRRYRDGFFA